MCGFALCMIMTLLRFIVCEAAPANAGILIIGDSNTELGPIAGALKDTLTKAYGEWGTGYLTLNDAFYYRDRGLTCTNGSGWIRHDMFNGTREPLPYLGPSGRWVVSSTVGAVTQVNFTGSKVDVYYAKDVNGGSFSITIDGTLNRTVNTSAAGRSTGKASITGLGERSHQMALTVTAGTVVLQGVDAFRAPVGRTMRAVVHNWGKGYATTQDFINIDSTIFATALQTLAPDVVVILLGENDVNIDGRSAADFQANCIRLITRIKTAVPQSRILLTSTFYSPSGGMKPEYITTAYPQAAQATSVDYWDMCTWFAVGHPASDPQWWADAYHVNYQGGAVIAREMWKQIYTRFYASGPRVINGHGAATTPRMNTTKPKRFVMHRGFTSEGGLFRINGAAVSPNIRPERMEVLIRTVTR